VYTHGSGSKIGTGPNAETNIMLLAVAIGLVVCLLVSAISIFICCRKREDAAVVAERNKGLVSFCVTHLKLNYSIFPA
jgi:hypothetical protein